MGTSFGPASPPRGACSKTPRVRRMRLAELHLLAYGALRETTLRFPAGASDLHLIFGPNAAGKSTARRAIGDALFGIPERTPMGFAIDQRQLRIGFALERDGETLCAVRRKGRKNTLLDAELEGDERPLDPARLEAWLANLGRERFEHAFALDDEALRRGGQRMVDGEADIAGLLFAASSGLTRLEAAIRQLETEAGDAFGTTRKASRRADQGLVRWQSAEARLKQAWLLAPAYRVKLERVASLEAQWNAWRETRRQQQRTAAEIELARRVLEPLARLERAEAEALALLDAPLLPEDAAATLAAALEGLSLAEQTIAQTTARLAELDALLTSWPDDAPLLGRAAELDAFLDRAAVVAREAAARPALLQRIDAAKMGLEAALRRAGTRFDDGLGVPPAASIERAQALWQARRTLAERRRDLELRLAEQTTAVAQAAARRNALGPPVDATALDAAKAQLDAYRTSGLDPEAAADAEAMARRRLDDALERLAPWPGPAWDLRLADLPSLDQEADWRRAVEAAEAETQALVAQAATLRASRNALAARMGAVEEAVEVLDAVALAAVRAARDTAWQRFRDAARTAPPPPDAAAAEAVERAMARADALADQRFAQADTLARLAADRAEHARQSQDLAGLEARLEELATMRAATAAAWQEASEGTPLAGVTLARAPAWREAAARVIQCRAEHEETARIAARVARRTASLIDQLRHALAEQGEEVGAGSSLEDLGDALVRARANVTAQQNAWQRADEAWQEAVREEERLLRERAAWAVEHGEHDAAWTRAMAALGLPADVPLEAAEDRLAALRTAVGAAAELADGQERLAAAAAEAAAVQTLADQLAADLGLAPGPIEAVKPALLAARRAATERAARRATLAEEQARLAKNLDDALVQRRDIEAQLAPLRSAAGVDALTALRAAVAASDRRRAILAVAAEATASLARLAPGEDHQSLRQRVAGRDAIALELAADEIAAALATSEREGEALQEALAAARLELARLDGSPAAAEALSDREEAAAAVARAIEDHLEQDLTARLLRRSLDSYRHAHETPLLRRASALFARLSGGEFQRLTVDYTRASGVLVAVRPNGALVERTGLSTGTLDQLYLALRLAALDLYLDRAAPLPFIVDDLFVQFSDDRAAIGLGALAELARRTQVLFFTHHQHLVDLARTTLGDDAFTLQVLPGPLASGGDEALAEGVAAVGQDGLDGDVPVDVDKDRRP
ncbi:MAG: hypothetical protein EA356_08770 [Geminicoccaceae bacterium]|nr:MAG: hypothetical protein EA356_08770 [Geminicoccaceae bacterium]